MQAASIVLVAVFAACLINFVRSGDSFHIARVLPWCGGHEPSAYDTAALVMLLLIPWGLGMLRRNSEDPD